MLLFLVSLLSFFLVTNQKRYVQNTIYDDERIELIVPPARGRRGFRPLVPPLVWQFIFISFVQIFLTSVRCRRRSWPSWIDLYGWSE